MTTEKPKTLDVAGIRIERLADGSARLTHPSGAVVIETKEQRDARTVELKARLIELQAALQADADFAALTSDSG
ncbi:MAG: hypothetical protein NTX87_02905 [Planctomycetota bacterium]|nr:hypothetical protein [Planctomycetota bacterium]